LTSWKDKNKSFFLVFFTLKRYNRAMFKYTVTEYQQCPPSLGGNWDSGTYTRVCFSNSPKKATSFQGATCSRFTGVDGCPIMERRTLERNGKVIFDIWD
jgi:hypothetical protein